MALDDNAFASDLCSIFNAMWNSADGSPRDNKWYAEQIAKRINDEIRNGDVQAGIPVVAGEQGATTDIGKIK